MKMKANVLSKRKYLKQKEICEKCVKTDDQDDYAT